MRIVESAIVPSTRTRQLAADPEWGWDGLAWLHGDPYEVLQVEGERCAFVMGGDTLLVHPEVMADIRAALPVHDELHGLGLALTSPPKLAVPMILPPLKLDPEPRLRFNWSEIFKLRYP